MVLLCLGTQRSIDHGAFDSEFMLRNCGACATLMRTTDDAFDIMLFFNG